MANEPKQLDDPETIARIEALVTRLRSVIVGQTVTVAINALEQVLCEVACHSDNLERMLKSIPILVAEHQKCRTETRH